MNVAYRQSAGNKYSLGLSHIFKINFIAKFINNKHKIYRKVMKYEQANIFGKFYI